VTRLELVAVAHGALRSAAGSFGPACTIVSADDAAALASFVDVASGAVSPRSGRVTLDGVPLVATPAARRSVASLLASEALPPARSVEAALALALAARADARRALDVLAPAGLEAWRGRPPHELDHDELRSLALALALSHEHARVLVLFEPCSTSAAAALGVDEAVARAVRRGAVVVLATGSGSGAARFGGPHCEISRGVLTGAPRDPSSAADSTAGQRAASRASDEPADFAAAPGSRT
jgi:ABC-type thiamine transport system ATPase subunit